MEQPEPLYCPPCQKDPPKHEDCTGWGKGFCGCPDGLCGIRLITRVMWTVQRDNQGDE